ncbi:MAG: CDP-alcohol phosphatidyltransferase family protein [Verrucomicrobia bacterium]|nr:CDP-alcohol phosphatidyltransferase family protein [Verrucomicrobiota bacterium]
MKIPAVLFCEPATGKLTIAALTLLDRLIVAVHRAGCGPVHVVCAGELPKLNRVPTLSIAFEVSPNAPALNGPAFVASASLLLTVGDVERLLATNGRLMSADGRALPAGVVSQFTGALPENSEHGTAVMAKGVAVLVTDAASACAAERALWASLTSSADGLVDRYFNRPMGRPLSKLLIHTSVTPNQVSVAATLIGVASAACFAIGHRPSAILGAVLLQLSAIVDCVDGDVARVVFKESPLGKWLDIVGDQVVHVGVFVAIGVGLARAGTDAPVLALAASAGVGVVISFIVVMRGLLNPELQKNTALQKLIDATTNRDFSVLLLALAFVDRLGWFLWLAAFGVHVFWLLALALQLRRTKPA